MPCGKHHSKWYYINKNMKKLKHKGVNLTRKLRKWGKNFDPNWYKKYT